MKAVVDIETNLAHDTIWCASICLMDENNRPSTIGTSTCAESFMENMKGVTEIIGHNIISFDLPVLERVWGYTPPAGTTITDTLVLARLLDPSLSSWTGAGHSLRAWAERAGLEQKTDFTDFDGGLTAEMIDYCEQDTRATVDVYNLIVQKLDEQRFSQECRELEHEVAYHIAQQERNGFMFDYDAGSCLYRRQKERMGEIVTELQEVFPPIVEERWSEKTGKRLKDKVEVFNPASRQQIARRLESKGVVWEKRTEKGNIIVDETTLGAYVDVPEAVLILEYLTLGKRSAMVKGWLDAYESDHRIHGYVNSNGTVTGRMTHSNPNMAQIPSGAEYRSCFVVPQGCKLVGVDASGLELRMLAHYMRDDAFTQEILDGDIHTANQKAFGCATRADAKTLIYALLYGAGDEKLGSIVGGSRSAGRRLRANYEQAWPAYRGLNDKVMKLAGKFGSVPGLDGRRVHVRSEHAALNMLLQSAGAIVMKKALVLGVDKCDDYGLDYKIVANVHDEWQIECVEEDAQRVAVCFRNAIREAGRHFDMRCPLEGDFSIGESWADTH